MKKCCNTSTATTSKPMNERAEILNLSSIDSTTSDVHRNVNPTCQPFSMRGYVAEMRNTNRKACIPFDGISEYKWEQLRGSLDVPHFRWWRCESCVREVVPCGTAADGRLNAEQTSLQSCIPEMENSSLELRASGGSELGDSWRCSEAINMVDNDGEREIPYTSPLELLARVAEMASDLPQLEETCQISNAENDCSFERRTAGIGTDAIVGDGDNSLSEVNDLVDSDDEREYKKVRSLKELMRVDEKASAGRKGVTTTRHQIEKKPSLSKGKGIPSEVSLTSTGEEYVGPLRSGKAKQAFSPNTDPILKKHAKATGSSPQPRLPRNRRNRNGGK